MGKVINLKDYRDFPDPELAPKDQVKRFIEANYPPRIKIAIIELVNTYQIKLETLLNKLKNGGLPSTVVDLVLDAKRNNTKNYALYNQLKLRGSDISEKGLDAIDRYSKAIGDIDQIVNGLPHIEDTEIDENKFVEFGYNQVLAPITKDDKSAGNDPSTANMDADEHLTSLPSDSFPDGAKEVNYGVYNSDQELTPEKVTEFIKETENNSIAPGNERTFEKKRKKSLKKTIGILIALVVAAATIFGTKYMNNRNNQKELENAERVYNASHIYVQMLKEQGIDTDKEFSEHIGRFKGNSQLDELSKISLGEMKTPFNKIENPRDLINDKEVIDNMDDILEENIADGGKLRQEMFKENNGDEQMGLWREGSYDRIVKSLGRK